MMNFANQIIFGDCIDVMRKMPDECINLVLTSPPYDNLREYNKSSVWNFDVFQNAAREIARVLKQGGVCVWIVADQTIKGSKSLSSMRQAMFFNELGLRVHDVMIWNKGSFNYPDTRRYGQAWEYMFVFSKGTPAIVNKIADRKNIYTGTHIHGTSRKPDGTITRKHNTDTIVADYGERFNVWEIPPCNSSNERCGHVAPFPVQLAADHIRTWTNENALVLDPFVGSGTTAVAATMLGRQFIGIEIDPTYHALASERVARESNNLFACVAGVNCGVSPV